MIIIIKRAARSIPRGIVLRGPTLTTLPVVLTSKKKPNVVITISIIKRRLTDNITNSFIAILSLLFHLFPLNPFFLSIHE